MILPIDKERVEIEKAEQELDAKQNEVKLETVEVKQSRHPDYLRYLSFSQGHHIPPTVIKTLSNTSEQDLTGFKHKFTLLNNKYAPQDEPSCDIGMFGLSEAKKLIIDNSIHQHNEKEPFKNPSPGQRHKTYEMGCGKFWTQAGKGIPTL